MGVSAGVGLKREWVFGHGWLGVGSCLPLGVARESLERGVQDSRSHGKLGKVIEFF